MPVEDIPVANWPAKNGVYKVVQVYLRNTPHLCIAATKQGALHADILRTFLELGGIPYELQVKDNHPSGVVEMGERRVTYEIPATSGTDYQVTGAGFVKITLETRLAFFAGSSRDYRIDIDEKHLEQIQKLVPNWTLLKGCL